MPYPFYACLVSKSYLDKQGHLWMATDLKSQERKNDWIPNVWSWNLFT